MVFSRVSGCFRGGTSYRCPLRWGRSHQRGCEIPREYGKSGGAPSIVRRRRSLGRWRCHRWSCPAMRSPRRPYPARNSCCLPPPADPLRRDSCCRIRRSLRCVPNSLSVFRSRRCIYNPPRECSPLLLRRSRRRGDRLDRGRTERRVFDDHLHLRRFRRCSDSGRGSLPGQEIHSIRRTGILLGCGENPFPVAQSKSLLLTSSFRPWRKLVSLEGAWILRLVESLPSLVAGLVTPRVY